MTEPDYSISGKNTVCFREEMKTEDEKTITRYYHKVLEAKLVLSYKVIISLEKEFIENEDEDVSKKTVKSMQPNDYLLI